jgi:hypothetical protein
MTKQETISQKLIIYPLRHAGDNEKACNPLEYIKKLTEK